MFAKHGSTLVWAAIVGALFAALVAIAPSELSVAGQAVLVVAAVVVTAGLAFQARRDLRSALIFTAISALLGLLVSGGALLFSMRPHPWAEGAAAATAAVLVVCFLLLLRLEFAGDPFRNLLRETFPAGGISEHEGVQFALFAMPHEIPAGDSFELTWMVQNGWSAQRRFVLVLRAQPRDSGLDAPLESAITLPASAAGLLRIPVSVNPSARGPLRLKVAVRVEGREGRLLRRWRARTWVPEVEQGFQILALLAGHLVWGGGLKISIRATPPVAGSSPTPPRPSSQEILWQPDASAPAYRVPDSGPAPVDDDRPRKRRQLVIAAAAVMVLIAGIWGLVRLDEWYTANPSLWVDNPGPEPLSLWVDGKVVAEISPDPGRPTSLRLPAGPHVLGYSPVGNASPTGSTEVKRIVSGRSLYNPNKTACYWREVITYKGASPSAYPQGSEGPLPLREFYEYELNQVDFLFSDPTPTITQRAAEDWYRTHVERYGLCTALGQRDCDDSVRETLLGCMAAALVDEQAAAACELTAARACGLEMAATGAP